MLKSIEIDVIILGIIKGKKRELKNTLGVGKKPLILQCKIHTTTKTFDVFPMHIYSPIFASVTKWKYT